MGTFLAGVILFSWPWLIYAGFFASTHFIVFVCNICAMVSVALATYLFKRNELSKRIWKFGISKEYLIAFLGVALFWGPNLLLNQIHFVREKGMLFFSEELLKSLAWFLLYLVAGFGEELGWRGYLLPKLSGIGPRKAIIVVGVIWSMWHWPELIGQFHSQLYRPSLASR